MIHSARSLPNVYNIDNHIAEIYDQFIKDTDDVDLLLRIIGEREGPCIFEPFCGTGWILIPLAHAGHSLTGLDQPAVLLDCCCEKLAQENLAVTLIEGDAVVGRWPGGFDVVVMGGNCLY